MSCKLRLPADWLQGKRAGECVAFYSVVVAVIVVVALTEGVARCSAITVAAASINQHLPSDIRVVSVRRVTKRFSARRVRSFVDCHAGVSVAVCADRSIDGVSGYQRSNVRVSYSCLRVAA